MSWFLELLRDSGLKKQVDECLEKKVIWPFPSKADSAGYSERIALCKEAGYTLYKGTNREEKNAQWILSNGNLILLSNILIFYILRQRDIKRWWRWRRKPRKNRSAWRNRAPKRNKEKEGTNKSSRPTGVNPLGSSPSIPKVKKIKKNYLDLDIFTATFTFSIVQINTKLIRIRKCLL